jgi:hypothetical protein
VRRAPFRLGLFLQTSARTNDRRRSVSLRRTIYPRRARGAPCGSSGAGRFFFRNRPMKTSTSLVSYSCSCSQTRSHNSVRVKTRPSSRMRTFSNMTSRADNSIRRAPRYTSCVARCSVRSPTRKTKGKSGDPIDNAVRANALDIAKRLQNTGPIVAPTREVRKPDNHRCAI